MYPEYRNYYNMYNNSNINYGKNNQNMFSNYNNTEGKMSLYNPYNGLIRGNLFKDIYVPYKSNEPYEIKPNNEQADILTKIDSLCFALVDLNLYLDVFPDNRSAIELYTKYNEEKERLVNEYESMYGPLSLNSESLSAIPWSWDNMPWPWDN